MHDFLHHLIFDSISINLLIILQIIPLSDLLNKNALLLFFLRLCFFLEDLKFFLIPEFLKSLFQALCNNEISLYTFYYVSIL